jgi:Restriction endonuclease fold toxin 7
MARLNLKRFMRVVILPVCVLILAIISPTSWCEAMEVPCAVASGFFSTTTFDCDGQSQPRIALDGSSRPFSDYDGVLMLAAAEEQNRLVGTFGLLCLFSESGAAKGGTQLARELGAAGERMSGITGPKTRIKSLTGTANYRVPDQLTTEFLKEAKNVGELQVTPQLIDFAKFASENSLRFILGVRQNTVIGPSFREFVGQYSIRVNKIYPPR